MRDAEKNTRNLYSCLPSVDRLLDALEKEKAIQCLGEKGESPIAYIVEDMTLPRAMIRSKTNSFLDLCRESIKNENIKSAEELSLEKLMPDYCNYLYTECRPHFRRVLNATGVVLHTNMGRAVLAQEAVDAVLKACSSYSNLEMNLATGMRGSRYSHVEELLCELTGAEGALVVNNNAAAVFLMLDSLCKGKEVVVSRGELVEIGGSFRIPEVMEKSGCILREVGASNRTHLYDYERAINDETAALLRVHQSNYRIIGFQGSVPLKDMVELGKKHGIPVLEDLGSGYLAGFTGPVLQAFAKDEPPVQDVVADGVDLVTFSGDKVLGGPQAGIIAGKKEYVEKIKKNPLNRALRIDKMTLAALEATLRLYLEPALATKRIPTLRMLCASEESLRKKANSLRSHLENAFKDDDFAFLKGKLELKVEKGESKAGGGSFPEQTLATTLLSLYVPGINPESIREELLKTKIPMIVRLHQGKIVLDLRTIDESELSLVRDTLCEALHKVLQGL